MARNPEVFWLLLILVPVLILMVLQFFNGRRSLPSVAGLWRGSDFYDLYTVKWFFSSLGFIAFLVFAVLALAGYPGKGYPVSYEPKGADIVFAVDVSNSMKAEDVGRSRIDAAAGVIRSVCENTPGGRFGLVVFKGRGVRVIPSTEDVEAVYSFLDFLNTDILSSPGSNIESGIDTALESFPAGEERKKYIILITDGEALSGELDGVLSRAVDREVQIYCVGAGTPTGAVIPTAEGPLTDPSGNAVISRLNEESLEYVARATGGKYYSVTDGSLLPRLILLAGGGDAEEAEAGFRIVSSDRYRFFLGLALLALLISRTVKVVKWKNLY